MGWLGHCSAVSPGQALTGPLGLPRWQSVGFLPGCCPGPALYLAQLTAGVFLARNLSVHTLATGRLLIGDSEVLGEGSSSFTSTPQGGRAVHSSSSSSSTKSAAVFAWEEEGRLLIAFVSIPTEGSYLMTG